MVIKRDPKVQLLHQINSLYVCEAGEGAIDEVYNTALSRLDFCFSHVRNKYYHHNGETIFNPLHVA